jgi:DNA-binding NarL/FixJ family response regulator
VKPINVILVDMPEMLKGLVRGVVVDEPDMDVVAEVKVPVNAAKLVADPAEPCAFIGSDRLAPSQIEELLGAAPWAKFLTLSAAADSFRVYELRPHKVSPDIGRDGVSSKRLAEAIRSARRSANGKGGD